MYRVPTGGDDDGLVWADAMYRVPTGGDGGFDCADAMYRVPTGGGDDGIAWAGHSVLLALVCDYFVRGE